MYDTNTFSVEYGLQDSIGFEGAAAIFLSICMYVEDFALTPI